MKLAAILLLIGCASGTYADSPARNLLDQYLRFKMPVDGKKKLPPPLQPTTVLETLNPWFREGLSQEKTLGDRYSGYELKKIPSYVFDNLKEATLGSEPRISFAVLTKQFWQRVYELQKKGLRVAVLSNSETENISGLFLPDQNLIAFDILAEPGTLKHEFRHYQQFTTFWPSRVPAKILSERCIRDASQAFEEIDATEFELSTYRGISFEIQNSVTLKDAAFPQVELFEINMFYPIAAGDYVNSSSNCPRQLVDSIRKIQCRIRTAADNLTFLLWSLRDLVKQDANQNLIAETRKKFESALLDEIRARRPANAQILSQLDRDLNRDLCGHVVSYPYLFECHDLMNEDEP